MQIDAVPSPDDIKELRQNARKSSARLKADRNASMDAQVLTVIGCLVEKFSKGQVSVKDISELFMRAYAADYERPITNRWLGYVIRRKLNLVTHKSHGNFIIPATEQPKLKTLFERYGVTAEDTQSLTERMFERDQSPSSAKVDVGDLGDVGQAAATA